MAHSTALHSSAGLPVGERQGGCPMSRSRIVAYVDESVARTVAAKAAAEDKSDSEWVGDAISEKIEREGMESLGERYEIEERLLDLVDESAERAAEKIVEELETERGGSAETEGSISDWGKSE